MAVMSIGPGIARYIVVVVSSSKQAGSPSVISISNLTFPGINVSIVIGVNEEVREGIAIIGNWSSNSL